MPYKSDAQRRFFNSEAGKKKIGEKEVEHWNKESKGMKLPEKAADNSVVYTLFVNKKPIKEFNSIMLPVSEAQKFMYNNGIKEGVLQSSLTGKQWKILSREIKDTKSEYDPITKSLKIKTFGAKDVITVFVDESDYRLSHHKNPSGKGTWIFGIGSKDMSAWKEFYGTYSEAKNQAKKVAAERNIKTIYTMG